MAKVDYEIPETHEFPVIPSVMEGAMAHSTPFVAGKEFQSDMGFPFTEETGQLIDGWKERFLELMQEKLSKYRSLQVFMDICVKCGACTDKCHYFIGTADPKNMPVARQDLLRQVYRRYFTFAGKYFPRLVGAVDLTEEVIKDMYSYYHQCSECRRCAVFCPFGIDTAEVTMAARDMLAMIGMGQKYSNQIIPKVHKIGNNLGLPEPALVDTLEGLEEEVEEDIEVKVRFPLDEKGAEILLVTPSADFFAEPHIDGLIGYAKVFHAAGVTWTMSSKASEAANFGLFIGNYEHMRQISLRIRDAAKELGVKRIIFGECGHAWRVAYNHLNTLAGPWDFLDQNYPIPQHILEFTKDCLDRNILNIDKSENDHMTLTFHDSCNIARASRIGDTPGSQFTTPRQVIQAVCNNYHDMAADTIHDATFCCGGGGGLLTDDLMELRIKGAQPRMESLKNVVADHGVTHMAAICAICKSQFTKVLPYYGMTMDQIVSVHQLVSNAIILEGQGEAADDSDDDADEAA
ncbi:MAG: (Fe-S)-binding protein [Gammaproteobacteria bacterium]|nr:MAG: (Fe-S)-binding protein [Gammaproteobacteria bacterium]